MKWPWLRNGRGSMVVHTLTSQLCLAAASMEVYVAFKSEAACSACVDLLSACVHKESPEWSTNDILLSPTCRIAGQNLFFLSVLIEQLSKNFEG